MVENFPNMGKEIANQVQEAQRVPYKINPRKNIPRHILIKLTKIKFKEKILKATRAKQKVTQKGSEKIFEEIIVENFPNMGKEIVNQLQEPRRVPYRINPRRNMPRHIVIKLAKIKDKEKSFKAVREK